MVVGNKDYKSHVKTNTCGPNTVKLGIQNSTIYFHDIPNISGQFDNYFAICSTSSNSYEIICSETRIYNLHVLKISNKLGKIDTQ